MSINERGPVIGEDVEMDVEKKHPRHARKRPRHSDAGDETGECFLMRVHMCYIVHIICRYVKTFYTSTCQNIKLIVERVIPPGFTHTERIDKCHQLRRLGNVHGDSAFEKGDGTIESTFEWSSKDVEWARYKNRKEGGPVGESEGNESVRPVSPVIYHWNPLLIVIKNLRSDPRWTSFSTSHGITKSVIDRVDLNIRDTTLRSKVALREYLFSN